MVFLSQKVDGNMIFTDYWKVLVLTFSEMGNTVFSWAKRLTEIWHLLMTGKFLFKTFRWWAIRSFFESRSWRKYDIYWLLRSSYFELLGDGKYGLFFSQKVVGKMIFTWSFRAFYDIPGPRKYGFSCSGFLKDTFRWCFFYPINLIVPYLLNDSKLHLLATFEIVNNEVFVWRSSLTTVFLKWRQKGIHCKGIRLF